MAQEKATARGERTRQAILAAAEKLFLANGYHGTSMRQIAREARIALGGIYNHFEGKEDIFHALLEEKAPHRAIIEALESVDGADGPEMLINAFNALRVVARERLDYAGLAITDMREFEGRTMRALATLILPPMLRFAMRAKAAGGLREDIDGVILLRLFISVLMGYMLTEVVGYSDDLPVIPGLPGGQQSRAGMLDILLHGVAERRDSM